MEIVKSTTFQALFMNNMRNSCYSFSYENWKLLTIPSEQLVNGSSYKIMKDIFNKCEKIQHYKHMRNSF